jgi:WD40 repeat protein
VKLWSRKGSFLKTLKGHSDKVNSVAFSPSNELIASASDDGTVKLWSREGEELTIIAHTNEVSNEKISPPSVDRISHSADEIGRKANHDQVTCVSFSPDSQLIATACRVFYRFGTMFTYWTKRYNTVKLWSCDGKLLRTLQGYSSVVDSVSFSTDGNKIAVAGGNSIELWKYDKFGVFQEVELHPACSNGVHHLETLGSHRNNIIEVSFSPDSQTLASASEDATVKLWGIRRLEYSDEFDSSLERRTTKFKGHNDFNSSVSFNLDSKTLVSDGSSVNLWDSDGKLLKTLEGSNGSFSPDGKFILTIADNTIKIWSDEGKMLDMLTGHSDYVQSVSFSPNSTTIASSSRDKTVKVWNIDGTLQKTFDWDVHSVSFSPDGKLLTVSDTHKTIKRWDGDGQLIETFSAASKSFSPDIETILKADDDTLKLWIYISRLFESLGVGVRSRIIFSPDGQTIAIIDDDAIKIWRRDGTFIKALEKHKFGMLKVIFSLDSQTIATINNHDAVKLWHSDGTLLGTLEGHKLGVRDLSFSPDGQTIASAGYDLTVRLWSHEGTLLKSFKAFPVHSLIFSPDSKTLALSGRRNILWLLNLDVDDLLVQGCNWVRDYLKTNPNVSESDRHLCDGIGTQQ